MVLPEIREIWLDNVQWTSPLAYLYQLSTQLWDGVDQMSVGFCVPHLLPIASGLGILTTQMVKSERNGGFISSINCQRLHSEDKK